MTSIRYGVVGTGMMGVEHIENINAIDGAVVTAISDPDASSRATGQAAAAIGNEAVFNEHAELLDSGLIDAVIVASPNHTHADVVLDVIERGHHFLAEKPLTTNVADAQRLVDAAADYTAVAWMGLEYRYKPPIARMIDEVNAGTVGDPKMVFIREHRFPFLEKVDNWNRFRENTGGTLVEKCCHFFDLMNIVAPGDPVRVMASGAQDVNHLNEDYDGRTPDIIDNAFVIVEYSSGVRACLDLCMFAEACRNEQELSVTGDKAKVEAFVPESMVRISHRDGSPWEEFTIDDSHVAYAGLHEGSSYLEHLDFHHAIVNDLPPKVTLWDGLLSVAMGVAAHKSIDEGRPVLMSEVM